MSQLSPPGGGRARLDPLILEPEYWFAWSEFHSDYHLPVAPAASEPADDRFTLHAGSTCCEPFLAKIIASSLAGSVLLSFVDTRCVLPGHS